MKDLILLLVDVIEGSLPKNGESLGYIYPSTLATGCVLRAARELLKMPKAEPTGQQKRIREAGATAHDRILHYFSDVCVAKEVPFMDLEHRIKGRCDALLYVSPSLSQSGQGLYALEIKTAGAWEYERVKEEGKPRLDHLRQCLIYQWGLRRCYGFAVRGGIIYYENRDTMDYTLFWVPYDEGGLSPILELTKAMLPQVREGKLPEGEEYRLPLDHWAHRYCPYLPICSHGQEAVKQKRDVPEKVRARIIAERIVRKKHLRKNLRSFEELVEELGWE